MTGLQALGAFVIFWVVTVNWKLIQLGRRVHRPVGELVGIGCVAAGTIVVCLIPWIWRA